MTPITTDVTVTSNIRAELGRRRLTVQELAQKIDMPRSTLGRKLLDLSPISVLELAKIATALDVPAESLLADDRAAGAA